MGEVWWGRTVSLGAMVVAFYLLVLRPQRQELNRHRKILSELKKGDRVVTTGGLVGTIAGFKGEHFVLVRFSEVSEVLMRKDGIDDLMTEDISI